MLVVLILLVGFGAGGGQDHFSQEEQRVLEELRHAGLLEADLEDMLALEDSHEEDIDYQDEMTMLEELRQAGV